MEGQSPLAAKEHLLDLGQKEELIHQLLEDRDDKEEDGSNTGSGEKPHDGEGRGGGGQAIVEHVSSR